jgi:hypothetical protein
MDVVTTTFTAPTVVPLGTTAVIVVSFTTVKLAEEAPPKVTLVAPVKLVPVIVTVLPPPSGPEAGLTEVMVGEPGNGVPGTKPEK